MIYAVPTMIASALALTAPATHPGGVALARPQLAQLAAGFAGMASVSAASAAEPRSTPWSFSTFLDAVEGGLIEKVSFSADGKQILCIDKDGNRHEALILPGQSAELIKLCR